MKTLTTFLCVIAISSFLIIVAVGVNQPRTHRIVDQYVDHHWTGEYWMFLMDNGDNIRVSHHDFVTYSIGDYYQYESNQIYNE